MTHTLANGIRVVGKNMPNYRSLTIGVWVKAGSACETPDENGISHFIEHMLFKGTQKRSAKQIAVEVDSIGGQINAFTSKECTCYHMKVMSEKVETAVEILSDIVLHSSLKQEEIDKERGVILEEINMSNDSPEDVAHETLSETFFEGTPVAKPILGPADNIRSFDRSNFIDYMDKYYYPENMVISVAGNYDEANLMKLLDKYFGQLDQAGKKAFEPVYTQPKACKRFASKKKDTEQVHICLSFPGFSLRDKDRYALSVLSNLIGGSMSSVLFQKIREERGLAYSAYSYQTAYSNAGMFSIYAGTSKNYTPEVLEIVKRELKEICDKGISREEFQKSKDQLIGNYILSTESTSSIMNNLGRNLLLLDKIVTEEETLRTFQTVTMEDVNRIRETVLDFDKATAVFVGNVDEQDQLKQLI